MKCGPLLLRPRAKLTRAYLAWISTDKGLPNVSRGSPRRADARLGRWTVYGASVVAEGHRLTLANIVRSLVKTSPFS